MGANSYGQLGQGHVEDQSLPQPAPTTAFQVQAARTLSGGGGHSMVVTGNGEVFVCGQNNKGQLGLGHTLDVYTLELCPSLRQKITNVSCGWDFTLLLSDIGQVLACGSNAFGQLGIGETVQLSANCLIVQSIKEPVVSTAAGLRHSLAVTVSGSVYQWGTGLCSHAKRVFTISAVPSHFSSKLPCLVPGLAKTCPRMVTAGMAHCLYLTEDGDVFMWGSNKHGQLTSSEPFVSSPISLKCCHLGGEKVTNVWSGWTHNVAQTESGRVFTWGRGNYGQLGRTGSANQNSELLSHDPMAEGGSQEACLPAEVKVLRGATQIACGSEHNLAIVGSCLLSWGWNEHGMCGDGSHTDVLQPRLIPGLHPLLIGCGAGHSLALCTATAPSQ
ncbi:secretion-regulating guanine nucleotide exchange factor isoform X2 [Boleophthalmus pectinirostris]|uniref:secretion-regulating guanine nucleotide exchange factor isoform X2 n=1 Tax=Boleophthalmus pectinirostris TaxID=150288 RepID=UPI00242E0184|nr:secretion-regulating guanine nucleotide exchange factor isoform X2 [Boleophthalmus pectinirostris]